VGDVVPLVSGRAIPGQRLEKPIECKECGEEVETARLQAIRRMNGGILLQPTLCISCAKAREIRDARMLAAARDQDDIVIVRR
jgi:hypothetical protein